MHAALTADWCCCQRTNCSKDALFMTTQQGLVTADVGKNFHPDGCTSMKKPSGYGPEFAHVVGVDFRAWSYGRYGVEGRATTTKPPLPTGDGAGFAGAKRQTMTASPGQFNQCNAS